MASWDDLPLASLEGITFPLASRKTGGGRAVARKKFPFRGGQVTEDTGREPRTWEYSIPLFSGMDGFDGTRYSMPLYPDTYQALVELAEDDTGQGYVELRDPEDGTVYVKIGAWHWSQEASHRNGGELSLTFEEEEPPSSSQGFSSSSDAAAVCELEAENLDAAYQAYLVRINMQAAWTAYGFPGLPPGFSSMSAYVGSFSATMRGGSLTFDQAAAQLDTMRRTLTAALALPAFATADAFRALWSVSTLIDSTTRLAEQAIADGPRVVQWVAPMQMSSHDIALQVYGDASFYLEIEQRNPVANPLFYPAGTVILAAPR